jgi:hypothetical protein
MGLKGGVPWLGVAATCSAEAKTNSLGGNVTNLMTILQTLKVQEQK